MTNAMNENIIDDKDFLEMLTSDKKTTSTVETSFIENINNIHPSEEKCLKRSIYKFNLEKNNSSKLPKKKKSNSNYTPQDCLAEFLSEDLLDEDKMLAFAIKESLKDN
jgi:hypothetical protein